MFLHINIASDRFGKIWISGDDGIVKIDPPSTFYEYKGPFNLADYNYVNGNFINGKFYALMSNQNRFIDEEYFFEIDTTDASITRKILTQKRLTWGFSGFIPVHLSCGVSYFLVYRASNSTFYYLDPHDGQYYFICEIPKKEGGFLGPTGGASEWMFDPNDCDVFIDLDINNSSGDMLNGYTTKLGCFDQEIYITDQDVDVYSDYGIMDSIQISLLNPLDAADEFLSISFWPAATHISSLHSIRIFPLPSTVNRDFWQIIRSVKYHNEACSPTIGLRQVRFIAYKNGITDTAFASIYLDTPFYNAGQNDTIYICRNDHSLIILESHLGSCYSSAGHWSNVTGIYNPAFDSSGIYTYTVGDSICGYDTSHILIEFLNPPNFDLGPDIAVCEGNTVELKVPNSLQVIWQDGSQSNQYLVYQTGVYSVQILNELGCKIEDSIFIQFLPNLLTEIKIEICVEDSFLYKGKYYHTGETVHDTISSMNSCDTIYKIQVSALAKPTLSIIGDSLICPGARANLTGLGNGHFNWSTLETSSSISVPEGKYSMTVTNVNGCTNTAVHQVQQAPEILYDAELYDPMCNGDLGSIAVQASGGIAPVRFFLNGMESRSGWFDQLTPGLYILRITDLLGCEKADTIQILSASAFDVDITDKVELDEGSSVLIKYQTIAGFLSNLQIIPDDGGIVMEGSELRIFGQADREYTIRFIDHQGCEIERKLLIRIRRNIEIYVPNAFSPNGDHINDFWQPVIGNAWTLRYVSVYDRYGSEVFHSSNATFFWDGRSKGQDLLPGVYVWHLSLRSFSGEEKEMYGELTLVR
ncbi:MAG: gliding motility-associated C-terminal domain-containing protein [Saprospiraceae bacterium]|nr:gliding motility-associated C-terminal domain-containing protein [Saprospiraceae bacterium]